MKLMQRFWQDEAGVIVSTEIILVVLILVLGLIAGMTKLRDEVVQELGDLGEAIAFLDASYEFVAPTYTGDATDNQGPATEYADDGDLNNVQTANQVPAGIDLDGHNSTFTAADGEDGLQ